MMNIRCIIRGGMCISVRSMWIIGSMRRHNRSMSCDNWSMMGEYWGRCVSNRWRCCYFCWSRHIFDWGWSRHVLNRGRSRNVLYRSRSCHIFNRGWRNVFKWFDNRNGLDVVSFGRFWNNCIKAMNWIRSISNGTSTAIGFQ